MRTAWPFYQPLGRLHSGDCLATSILRVLIEALMGAADLEGCGPSQPRNPLWALFPGKYPFRPAESLAHHPATTKRSPPGQNRCCKTVSRASPSGRRRPNALYSKTSSGNEPGQPLRLASFQGSCQTLLMCHRFAFAARTRSSIG